VAENREEMAAPARADAVKAFALAHEADQVGIAAVDADWVFEGIEMDEPWVIVLGVAMDHAKLATAPTNRAGLEVQAQYNRGTRAARALANHIRGLGWKAEAHGGPWAGPMLLTPAALACGFGELGKHGSIINRTYGSSFRLAAVTTDLPLIGDGVDEFGADDFCASCQVCAKACPPGAIGHDKKMVRGAVKWSVDFDTCIPYFNDTLGCAICIAVCPWSRPGTAPSLAQRMTRRRERSYHNE
jgi:epoxyqueuosine reductase QueG